MSDLRILWEDDDLIFVDKPAGLLSQQAHDPSEPDLHAAVRHHLEANGETAYLLQRLDRGTTGVIFFPKQKDLNAKLNRAFERKEIIKTYLALVEGEVTISQMIDAPIARIGPITFGVRLHGRRATTSLRPLKSSRRASVLELTLHTGRTHQIRVHLAAVGHPLVGDWLYGTRDDEIRPMLHALQLTMKHPRSGEDLVVAAPLPSDFIEQARTLGIAAAELESTAGGRLSG